MKIEIRQARTTDIPVLEAIFADVVNWMDDNGLHQWEHENVKWHNLSRRYAPSDFYIAYIDDVPGACMALIDHDPNFWPDIPRGESLYLHKVAVKREFSGKGISKALIDFAKQKAMEFGIQTVRLDCHRHRHKVRELYEKQGFACVEERTLYGKYDTAFYVCKL